MRKKRTLTWVVAISVVLVAMVLGLLSLVLIGYDTGKLGFVFGFLMATVPVPFYVTFALWLDRFEPEPPWLLALAFIWGAAIATFFSLVFNTVNTAVLSAVAGMDASVLGSILSAPLVEESAKGLALLLLYLWQRDEFDNVTDGIVYATMVGLGFAMTENVSYYGRQAIEGGSEGAMVLFFLRGVMSPFSHPLFTSMTGIGLGVARESDKTWIKWMAPIAGISCAMFLHFLWNLSASFGALFFVAYFVVMFPALLAVLIVGFFSLRREARVVRLHLETVAADGVMSGDDLETICSVWGRVGASSRALFGGGFSAWRACRRFHRIATELAFHSWRESRGMTEQDAEMRNELLDTLRAARADAGLPPVTAAPAPEMIRRLSLERPLPPEALAAAAWDTLVFTSGPLAGREFELGPTGLHIGRDPASAQIVISEPRVSKRHAWVGYRDGGLVITDHGSTNGTFLNGAKIRDSAFGVGDRIGIAEVAEFEVRPG